MRPVLILVAALILSACGDVKHTGAYKAGHDEGYELGYDEGHTEGYTQAWSEICDKIEKRVSSGARSAVCD